MPVPQDPPPGGCGRQVALTNGGFESPHLSVRNNVSFLGDASQPGGVPGWRTTASDHQIEIWPAEYGVPADEGSQFAR
ncbi:MULTISPECIES: hypothetical protein [unclassified Nonomuraea]|uniref:hypothetical protein n=1 Tax=unclassified Nonomuraea TaxID=2593643 RepID=UPI0034139228